MSYDWIEKATTKWNLELLYKSDLDPQIKKDIEECISQADKFSKKYLKNDTYLSDPIALKKALDEYELWERKYGAISKYGYYLSKRQSQDQTNAKIKAEINKLSDLSVSIVNKIQFFELNISKLPAKVQTKMLENKHLSEYKHYLKRLFEVGKHTLSDKEERIVNLMSKTSLSNWYYMVSEFIAKEEREVINEKGEKEVLPFASILSLTSNNNKKIRKLAGEKVDEILEKHLEVATAELNTIIENKKVDDMLRNYKRPDESAHLGDDISTKVVDSLVEAVTQRFDIPKKYYKFKAKLLGQDTLSYYERAAEYGKLKKEFDYKQSLELVYDTFFNLDPEFAGILKEYVLNGQIEAFPAKGKTGGAYCAGSGTSKELPTYILLNHTNKLNDVLTIAHELGHGINNELVKKTNNQLNFGTPTSTAEVASTFMEDFVLQELLANSTDEEKLVILMQKLDADIATVFRQIACYNFEFEMHMHFREQGYVSKEDFQKMFFKHMKAYMGEAAKGCENWWVYWGHLRYYFYVYTYSSGLLISKALQANVEKDKKYILKVKQFLSAGLSKSPQDIFLDLGIDISKKAFWLQGINEIEDTLKTTMDLARRLKKI